MSASPPIRVVTRALAEMQTSILTVGLPLTGGDLDRFAIFSLVVRLGSTGDAGARPRGVTVASLADSLAKPYESVRRQVGRLVDDGLCSRGADGVRAAIDAGADGTAGTGRSGTGAVRTVWDATHTALIRFVERLRQGGVELPADRGLPGYADRYGVGAAVDLMLTVLDANSAIHANWQQLAIFSAVLAFDHERLLSDPALARRFRDETAPVPAALCRDVRLATIARTLGLPETTVRRYGRQMLADGMVEGRPGGVGIAEEWLNRPAAIAVSRRTFSNVRRILEQLAARNFPFDRLPDPGRGNAAPR